MISSLAARIGPTKCLPPSAPSPEDDFAEGVRLVSVSRWAGASARAPRARQTCQH